MERRFSADLTGHFRHDLPPEIEMLFTKQPPIQDVFEMALGENWAYFVSYRDADGGVYCRKGFISSIQLPWVVPVSCRLSSCHSAF